MAKAPGGKPAPASPGAATRGRPGSEGITPLRLPSPSSPSSFLRRRAGAAPLALRPPGPARPASPQAAGARPRGPARELCREEKLGSQSGRQSEARGGGAALRWARGAAGARRGVQASPRRRLPRALVLRAVFLFASSPRLLARARGRAGDVDRGADGAATSSPARRPPAGGRFWRDPSSGCPGAGGRWVRQVCITAGESFLNHPKRENLKFKRSPSPERPSCWQENDRVKAREVPTDFGRKGTGGRGTPRDPRRRTERNDGGRGPCWVAGRTRCPWRQGP